MLLLQAVLVSTWSAPGGREPVAAVAPAALTLPKLSAYARYSEDISCKEGEGWAGPSR